MDKNNVKKKKDNKVAVEEQSLIDPSKPSKWTKDHEKILVDWADKAMCYRWLHAKSNHKLSKINTYFTIPVIIMSTITGTANFASERVPEQYRGMYSMVIGGVNILAGIITTIQQFLKISETNEAHRVSSISWDKFYRKIRVELSKPPNERQNVYDFLKSCTEEFDRLMETSPVIQKPIIELFNRTFNGDSLDEDKKKMFKSLKKPEICDSLESVQYSMYKEDETAKKARQFKEILYEAIDEKAKSKTNLKLNAKNKVIQEFVKFFSTEMMRPPTKQEIMNNLDTNELNISSDDVSDFMRKNKKLFDKVKPKQIIESSLGDIEMGNRPDHVESDSESEDEDGDERGSESLMQEMEDDAQLTHL